MTSINPHVQELHRAYIEAMGMDAEDLPMTMTYERWWQMAHLQGLTPDAVKLCVKARLAFNRSSSCKKGIEIKHLARDEDDVAVVLNEVAVIRSQMRVKVMPPNKAEALRQTGRSDELPTPDAVKVGDMELIKALRKAAG